jgi:hypothetical protein
MSQSFARNFAEKRDFIRMRVNTSAILCDASGREWACWCHNLSGGGALLELPVAANLIEPVKITVTSSYGHQPVFAAVGHIVRRQTIASGRQQLAIVYQDAPA